MHKYYKHTSSSCTDPGAALMEFTAGQEREGLCNLWHIKPLAAFPLPSPRCVCNPDLSVCHRRRETYYSPPLNDNL